MPNKIIISLIGPQLQVDGRTIHPKDVIAKLCDDHDIQILYTKAWRVKKYAENLIFGEPMQFFQQFPLYLYMLE